MIDAFLLDTHVLLWWMSDARELSKRARKVIGETDNMVLISAASLWEVAIKTRKGKLLGCEDYLSRFQFWHDRWGFATLDIKPEHAVLAGSMRVALRDPFDRMLIAQSKSTGTVLITSDGAIREAHSNCLW